MSQPKVLVEVRPRLQSCQVYYRIDESTNSEIFSLSVQTSAITFKCDLLEEKFSFDGIKLKPVFINNLKGDEENIISCRLQTLISIDDGDYQISASKYIPIVESDSAVQLNCRYCLSNLLKVETTFRRILPLPSSDLSFSDIFCHPCGDEQFDNSRKIKPKLDDLLYGNYFFKINYELLCESKFFVVKDIVYCQQCRTWLGTKENGSLKMWHCTVSFDSEGESGINPKEDFICVLRNALEDFLSTMCKFIISHKATTPASSEFLLLWIMDRNLPILVSCENSSKLIQKSSIKLLFSHEKSDSSLVPLWHKDSNVNTLDVAEVMFTEGLNYLLETNMVFPKLFRKSNNMSVGFLIL